MSPSSGHLAEQAAANFLKERGCIIVEQNWRRPYGEIDIIVKTPSGSIQFVEVKYRRTDYAGDGLAYITRQKLTQMRRAALGWMEESQIMNIEVSLAVIAVTGDQYVVTDYLEDVS